LGHCICFGNSSNEQSDLALNFNTTILKVQLESELLVEDFQPSKKLKRTDEESEGGFSQPRLLSIIAREYCNHIADSKCDIMETVEEQSSAMAAAPEPPELSSTSDGSNLARQICRNWLKHHYLGLGKPCNDSSCKRKHEIIEKNPERLYKDYSFKGLTPKQRKVIINAVKDATATTVQSSSSSSSSPSSSPSS